ncbi:MULTISPECIES: YceI family protein [unclassified Chryseobacterium]|uniref:YceI family protein n=1 Tax=unclassified Chryseobacterium TaxID=2593645 RepID=UPI0012CD71A6|nr:MULTISPECIES: YceI family protein [unclassified Chryseobacterium]MPS65457.1 YceI family protein [Chryseobacterium sp.]UMQ42909.1 YceI family protein [Chryseobacterium sp. Y16C]
MDTKIFKVNSEKSLVEWIGRKVTGAHNGTIEVKEGNFTFENENLLTGKFVINTKSITIIDVEDAETNAQFASHLASDDFFNSDQYPEATFEITHTEPGDNNLYYVKGDLTIKGITHSIDTALQIVRTDNVAVLDAKIVIDRTKFNIKFRSANFFANLGDTLIYNNFDLNIHLVAETI